MDALIACGVQMRALAAGKRARAEERRVLVIARRDRVHGIGVR